MHMGIFDRMGKVIASNVNALLDKVEDDKKLLELNLEEMADQLRAGRGDIVAALASEKGLVKKAQELRAEAEKWNRRAELALRSGDEALAREALVQKRRIEIECDQVEQAGREQRSLALTMKTDLERMEQKLEEFRLRKSTIATRAQQARAGGGAEALAATPSTNSFDEFRKMEDKISHQEHAGAAAAELEAALKGPPEARDLEAKFQKLEEAAASSSGGGAGSTVDDELAALKKRICV